MSLSNRMLAERKQLPRKKKIDERGREMTEKPVSEKRCKEFIAALKQSLLHATASKSVRARLDEMPSEEILRELSQDAVSLLIARARLAGILMGEKRNHEDCCGNGQCGNKKKGG
jgi:hypothetical protein